VMSYQEKKARRRSEIEGLKEAKASPCSREQRNSSK